MAVLSWQWPSDSFSVWKPVVSLYACCLLRLVWNQLLDHVPLWELCLTGWLLYWLDRDLEFPRRHSRSCHAGQGEGHVWESLGARLFGDTLPACLHLGWPLCWYMLLDMLWQMKSRTWSRRCVFFLKNCWPRQGYKYVLAIRWWGMESWLTSFFFSRLKADNMQSNNLMGWLF